MARRPHRARQGAIPPWLQRERAAIAFYQARHPGLTRPQVRTRPDYRAAWRLAQSQQGKKKPDRSPAKVIGVKGAGLPRRPHRKVVGRARVGGFWQDRYQDAVAAYQIQTRYKTGERLNHKQARERQEFKEAWKAYRVNVERLVREEQVTKVGRVYRGKKADISPDGEWARALVILGWRDADWDWDVGDTPKHVKETRSA